MLITYSLQNKLRITFHKLTVADSTLEHRIRCELLPYQHLKGAQLSWPGCCSQNTRGNIPWLCKDMSCGGGGGCGKGAGCVAAGLNTAVNRSSTSFPPSSAKNTLHELLALLANCVPYKTRRIRTHTWDFVQFAKNSTWTKERQHGVSNHQRKQLK